MDEITAQKIKDAADIVAVISDFVELHKRGVNYTGICPFHDDHTEGNFLVSKNRGIYKCFKCGAGGDSVHFLMEHEKLSYIDALYWLAQKFSISIPDTYDKAKFANIKPAKPLSAEDVEPAKELLVIPRNIVLQTTKQTAGDLFCNWFRSLPWELEQRTRLDNILWLYCVGHYDGRVCFWQIDEQKRPRGGKLMVYKPDGHRDKARNPGWIYNQPGIRDELHLDKYEYRSTLFGMHLTARYPHAIIHIVESEKTALVCATHYGDLEHNLWLACGGLKFLKIEALRPLFEQGRTIYLWPDKDGLDEWERARNAIIDRYHPTTPLQINTEFLSKNWKPEDGPKADVADIIIRLMNEAPILEVLKDHVDGVPFLPQDELNDPDLHAMRQKLRRLNMPAQIFMPSKVEGVETVGEILQRAPHLKPLFYNTSNPKQT